MADAQPGLIVVGVDGSAAARAAARWAADDAVLRGVPLRLLHVLDHPASAGYPAPALVTQPVTEHMRSWARQLLHTTASTLGDVHPQLTVETAIVEGRPWSVLVDESATASLTVLGSHGGGQIEEVVLGSVASRLTAHAHGSVAIVRTTGKATSRHPGQQSPAASAPVVVGVDGSAEADGAISFAFGEAVLRRVPLVAVHAWNDRPLEHSLGDHGLHLDADSVHAEENRELLRHLSRWVQRYPDVSVRPVVIRGRPAAALLSYLAQRSDRPPQLVVVGHRGRGGFARLLLGSTSTALVGHAGCPVVVVRDWHQDGTTAAD